MAEEAWLGRLYRLERRGMHWGLDGIRALLRACGHPEREFASILVGGTNGKGSTAAVLERILREAGYRTGLYTSPHLVSFRERIRVDGRAIPAGRLRALVAAQLPRAARGGHSFFEAATAIALRHFADEDVEVAVLEVGMGGRLDSTNVVAPELSVITGVSLEHVEILGPTLESIAFEKSGIARRGRVTVVGGRGRARTLLEREVRDRGALAVRARRAARLEPVGHSRGGMVVEEAGTGTRYRTTLAGVHQVSNLECAVAAARQLRGRGFDVPERAVARGVRAARWPARFEWLPRHGALLDVAHNPEAAAAFAASYRRVFPRPGVVVLGMLSDKDAAGVVRRLRACGRVFVATAPRTPRALSPEGLARALGRLPHRVAPDVKTALSAARAERRRGEPLIVIGSLYTVGEAIPELKHHVPEIL